LIILQHFIENSASSNILSEKGFSVTQSVLETNSSSIVWTAQGTVCAGGRYDGLIEQLGGKANHAVGFAMGIERLVLLLETRSDLIIKKPVDAYLLLFGDAAEKAGTVIAEEIRNAVPQLRLQMHCGAGSFKSQFKKADKSGADYALILGEDELQNKLIGLKFLRTDAEQKTLTVAELIDFLQTTHS